MHLFLHGFLGQKEDWDPLFEHLPEDFQRKAIDLPVAEDLAAAVHQIVPSCPVLIGYSAGGRLALEMKSRFPENYGTVIAISSHPGLTCEKEKAERWKRDQEWISLLEKAPFSAFLEKWYAQDLFNGLDTKEILTRRMQQNPKRWAHFLTHFSVAKKNPPQIYPNTLFIYGKNDLKYAQLFHKIAFSCLVESVENAGHTVHLENPQSLAEILYEHRYEAPNIPLGRSKTVRRYPL